MHICFSVLFLQLQCTSKALSQLYAAPSQCCKTTITAPLSHNHDYVKYAQYTQACTRLIYVGLPWSTFIC